MKTDAMLSHVSNAALYGRGVFTTVAIVDGRPFLWEKHWLRLSANALTAGVDLAGFDENDIVRRVQDEIAKAGANCGRLRLAFFDAGPAEQWTAGEGSTSLSILVGERRKTPDTTFEVYMSPYAVNSASPLAGVKSCNYLENILAREDARLRGSEEAIRLNEKGYVTSGCMSNIFWTIEGKLYTPAISTGCLPGTTREYVLENLECEEVEAGAEDIRRAEDVYFTSAGIGVAAATELEGKKLARAPHPILELLPF
jgi:branched-chain amino acid aminotransferase